MNPADQQGWRRQSQREAQSAVAVLVGGAKFDFLLRSTREGGSLIAVTTDEPTLEIRASLLTQTCYIALFLLL